MTYGGFDLEEFPLPDEQPSRIYLLAYDLDLRRPACAILAAGIGADPTLATLFPVESWLTSPTAKIRVFRVTDAQLDEAIEATGGTI